MKKGKSLLTFEFDHFGKHGCPVILTESFQNNLSIFLNSLGSRKEFRSKPVTSYQVQLDKEGNKVSLHVFKVEDDSSCIECMHTGIGVNNEPVYHIVIHDSKKTLGAEFMNQSKQFMFHATFHKNGNSHVLGVNGIEAGSLFLTGREIMDFWDHLSHYLKLSLITCKDEAQKRGMDLRILYGIGFGHSWIGRWKYKSMNGIPGFNTEEFDASIATLAGIDLDEAISEFNRYVEPPSMFTDIVNKYRSLSDGILVTMRDLFKFMLSLRALPNLVKKSGGSISGVNIEVFDDLRHLYIAIVSSNQYVEDVAIIRGPHTYFAKRWITEEYTYCMVCKNRTEDNEDNEWPLQVCQNCIPNVEEEREIRGEEGDHEAEVICSKCGIAEINLNTDTQNICSVCYFMDDSKF